MGERMLNLVESLYEYLFSRYRKRIKKSNRLVILRLFLRWLLMILVFQNRQPFYFIYILLFPALCKMRYVAIPLGQTAGQKIIHDFKPALVKQQKKFKN